MTMKRPQIYAFRNPYPRCTEEYEEFECRRQEMLSDAKAEEFYERTKR